MSDLQPISPFPILLGFLGGGRVIPEEVDPGIQPVRVGCAAFQNPQPQGLKRLRAPIREGEAKRCCAVPKLLRLKSLLVEGGAGETGKVVDSSGPGTWTAAGHRNCKTKSDESHCPFPVWP